MPTTMGHTTAAGHLKARSLSHGGIAGAVIGAFVGASIIFILTLPFILRAIREWRYHKKIAQENAEMGVTGPAFYGPPGHSFRHQFYPHHASASNATAHGGPATFVSADATATLSGSQNSSEDSKPFVLPPSPPAPARDASASGASATAAHDDTHAGHSASAPTIVSIEAVPEATAPAASVPLVGSAPPASDVPTESLRAPAPILNAAATFPTLGPNRDPTIAPRQRSATMRSSRHSSISSSIGGFAGRAAAIFRQGSTRSVPTRSPSARPLRATINLTSPVEIPFDYYAAENHHTWLMRQQGIDDSSFGIGPSFFEIDPQYLTGASAEYYSGAPLSPPTDPSSSLMSPISYAPTPPSIIASSFASMASAAAVAGVATGTGAKKQQSKPFLTRTESLRASTTDTELSPLPLSPTSPLSKVQESIEPTTAEEITATVASSAEPATRDAASPAAATARTETTPEAVEFLPHSPSHRVLVPSPQLPAPGTVNPRDVWAPATDDERFVHTTVELDRIEKSPVPAAPSSSQPSPAAAAEASTPADASSPSADPGAGGDLKSEACGEASAAAAPSPAQPTPFSEPSPDADLDASSMPVTSAPAESSLPPTSPAPLELPAPLVLETPVAESDNNYTDKRIIQPTADDARPVNDVGRTDANATPADATNYQPLLFGNNLQGGIGFPFDDSHQLAYLPNINNGVFPVDGNAGISHPSVLPQHTDTTYWNIHTGVPDLAVSYLPPTTQTDFSNGILLDGPYPTSNNGGDAMGALSSVNGMNRMGGLNAMDRMGGMNGMNGVSGMNGTSDVNGVNDNGMNSVNGMNGMNGVNGISGINGINGVNGANGMHGVHVANGNGLPNLQYSLHTPQSSPSSGSFDVYASNSGPGPISVPGMAMPITPPPPMLMNSFNSPLSVHGSDGTHGPASPLSTGSIAPTQASASSPRTFACDECGRHFDQIHKLNHHKRYHERPHECTVAGCGKRFGTKTHLDRHTNDKHSKSRKYHCTEEGCPYSVPGGKSFPRKDNWRRHMVNKHGVHPEHEPIEVIDQPMADM